MNARIALIACLTAAVCMLVPVSAFAEKAAVPSGQTQEPEMPRDVGLISDYSLSVSNDSDTVYITAQTISNRTMAEIGEINIEVQRSANGVNGWSAYATVPKQTNYNSGSHYLSSYGVDVASGYYYRVKLTHYAEEDAWFWPETQSINRTSGIMRVY